MGKIDAPQSVLATLQQENKSALPSGMLQQYADLFATYREAARNIAKCGVVVAHPKTGAPIENPYLKVRQDAMVAMRKCTRVKADRVWAALSEELEADARSSQKTLP